MKRGIAYIVVLLFALQSCIIYKHTPVSLQQAAEMRVRVKVIGHLNQKQIYDPVSIQQVERGLPVIVKGDPQNQKWIYDRIILVDTTYYGVRGRASIPLKNDLGSIYPKSKGGSTAATIFISVVPPVVYFSLFYLIVAGFKG